MVNETIDWADVAAVGVIADVLSTSASRGPVASLLEDLRREWCRDFRGGFTRDVGKAASALREAFEAGQRESCRELSARRAVDGWLATCPDRELFWHRGQVAVCGEYVGHTRMPLELHSLDYPALAAALGLEVEDE